MVNALLNVLYYSIALFGTPAVTDIEVSPWELLTDKYNDYASREAYKEPGRFSLFYLPGKSYYDVIDKIKRMETLVLAQQLTDGVLVENGMRGLFLQGEENFVYYYDYLNMHTSKLPAWKIKDSLTDRLLSLINLQKRLPTVPIAVEWIPYYEARIAVAAFLCLSILEAFYHETTSHIEVETHAQ